MHSFVHCCSCGIEINPVKYVDCEVAYETPEGECFCKECIKDYLEKKIEDDMDEVAEALGIDIVPTAKEDD